MEILKKYKKNLDAGFKDFVINLDLRSSRVVKEMLANGLLEDPVYLKWALENKLGFDYLFKLEQAEIQKIVRLIPNYRLILLHSLKNHREEMKFMSSHFPGLVYKQYLEDREVEQVTASLQENARIKIMEIIFELKDSGELPAMEWKLPPYNVLAGTSHEIDARGIFRQYYDNGVIALTGTMEKGKRAGKWMNYYPDGSLHAEGEYQEGQKENEWVIYYRNGAVKAKGQYHEDLKNGKWVEYEMDGTESVVEYVKGKII